MLNFFTEPTQGLLEVCAVFGKLILFKMFLNLTALILFKKLSDDSFCFVCSQNVEERTFTLFMHLLILVKLVFSLYCKAWCMLLVYTSVTPCVCTISLFKGRHSFGATTQGKIQKGTNNARLRHSLGTV